MSYRRKIISTHESLYYASIFVNILKSVFNQHEITSPSKPVYNNDNFETSNKKP